MDYILETHNLTKVYGQKEAAKDVNLHIREGQIYGLIVDRNSEHITKGIPRIFHLFPADRKLHVADVIDMFRRNLNRQRFRRPGLR